MDIPAKQEKDKKQHQPTKRKRLDNLGNFPSPRSSNRDDPNRNRRPRNPPIVPIPINNIRSNAILINSNSRNEQQAQTKSSKIGRLNLNRKGKYHEKHTSIIYYVPNNNNNHFPKHHPMGRLHETMENR